MIALPQPFPHSQAAYARKAAILTACLSHADDEDTRRHLLNRINFNRAVAAGQVQP